MASNPLITSHILTYCSPPTLPVYALRILRVHYYTIRHQLLLWFAHSCPDVASISSKMVKIAEASSGEQVREKSRLLDLI